MNRVTEQHTNDQPAMWTETFTLLHHAATTGAPAEEIRRLEAAELAELTEATAAHGGDR